ncbi:hypothetical protein HH212_08190 [Massilia forsythiae]|uniref:Uncharacterized protein n=1 Tax=Massilia forsythiae TaxID=2728020 RepID=A0A7Z2VW36_9BURK|nr:hypothetical protein [Massilia forsythiae]QJE00007.1 hypothetical protein HH212_08190 [Massilia forsythiae]
MDLSIRINHVFKPHEDAPFSSPCRVIWLNADADVAVLMSIEKVPRQPWLFELSALAQLLREMKVSRVELKVPEFMMALEDEIPLKYKTMRDENWERIRPLLEGLSDGSIFQPRTMGALIQSHAQRINVERRTIYRLLYRYWMFGAIRNALLPQYVSCGGKGKERTFSGPRGRPPRAVGTEQPPRAKSLSEDDKSIIRIGYALYRDNKVKTITDAYTRTLRRYYCEAIATPEFPETEPLLKPLRSCRHHASSTTGGKRLLTTSQSCAAARGRGNGLKIIEPCGAALTTASWVPVTALKSMRRLLISIW